MPSFALIRKQIIRSNSCPNRYSGFPERCCRTRSYSDTRRDDAFLLENYIDSHFSQPLTSSSLCEALNVGKTKLYSLCSERFGMTPMQLVTHRRMRAAADLLRSTPDSIRAIAQATGIGDENYFSKVFKKWSGFTPSDYRRQALSDSPGAAQ